MAQSPRLAVCLLNISEARNPQIIENVARAACGLGIPGNNVDKKFKCPSTVLNIFSDYNYNRSVLTIAALVSNLEACVTNACKVAYAQIDFRNHSGGHPRLGAVDLIPIYPISPLVTLKHCGEIARGIGNKITTETPGTSVFFFGAADCPKTRGLVERRKEVGWYKGRFGMCYDNIKYDIGAVPNSRYGCTGVGASFYVMNCNVTIETDDMLVGRKIANAIRDSSMGGLPGVQAMAFDHEGCIEIACNVESYRDLTTKDQEMQSGQRYTTPQELKARVKTLASEYGINTKEATVVGFTPNDVHHLAYEALSQGNRLAWKSRNDYRM